MTDPLQERMDADRIIAALARENVELREKVASLSESVRRRDDWLNKAKRDAGASEYDSFDFVWDEALQALKEKRANSTAN